MPARVTPVSDWMSPGSSSRRRCMRSASPGWPAARSGKPGAVLVRLFPHRQCRRPDRFIGKAKAWPGSLFTPKGAYTLPSHLRCPRRFAAEDVSGSARRELRAGARCACLTPDPGPKPLRESVNSSASNRSGGADECALAAPCALLDLKLSGGNSELALAAEKIAADYLARHARDDVLARAASGHGRAALIGWR